MAREDMLLGGWFAAPEPDADDAFNGRYHDAFGTNPPQLASLAYDAVALVALLSGGEPYHRFTQGALMDPNGFAGVDGIFRFNADGTSERGLAVLEVRRTAFMSSAPRPRRSRSRVLIQQGRDHGISTSRPRGGGGEHMPSCNVSRPCSTSAAIFSAIRPRAPAHFISRQIKPFGQAQIHQQMFARRIGIATATNSAKARPLFRHRLAPAFRQTAGRGRHALAVETADGHARRDRRRHNRHSANRSDCAGFPSRAGHDWKSRRRAGPPPRVSSWVVS